ncbi:MAG TPA: AmmeMemoRadiSam system radical SAM enzyme [Candidatus Limnocylindrales bacterium]
MALSVPTILAERRPDGAVRCNVCAHRCLVRPGREDICHVRANRDGILESTAYGRIVAAALDPIEKKPLFHVEPGSRAWSIATPGCPFHCTFCQNWQIAQGPRIGGRFPTRVTSPEEVVEEALEGDADAIAYTYVEPTVFLEYTLDVGRLAHEAGLRNLFITDGYATPEAIALLATVIDAANVDLKSFDDAFYRRLCGARLRPVLDGIVAMRDAGLFLELTTLVIPGYSDDEANLRGLTRWIVDHVGAETPWHVSRFYPAYQLLDVPPTPVDSLRRAAEIGHASGLAHVYIGNAPELEAEDTRCAGCGRVVIERHGYRVRNHLRSDATCRGCGRRLAGLGLSRGTTEVEAMAS